MRTCLITISFFLFSCSDKFPANDLYRINHVDKICEVYKIDSDKIHFKYDHELPFDNCPTNIFGFNEEDAGQVTAWARRQKRKLSK